jgi:hypothetical protein
MSWLAPSDHVKADMDKLKPDDPRYKRKYADINGHRWGKKWFSIWLKQHYSLADAISH